MEELEPDAEVTEGEAQDCAQDLVDEEVEAVVGMELDLIQMLAVIEELDAEDDYVITGEQATTAGYSPFVVRGMAAFASDAFNDMREDGRWVDAYNRWVAPLTGKSTRRPPEITLEEAAAIYPIEFERRGRELTSDLRFRDRCRRSQGSACARRPAARKSVHCVSPSRRRRTSSGP